MGGFSTSPEAVLASCAHKPSALVQPAVSDSISSLTHSSPSAIRRAPALPKKVPKFEETSSVSNEAESIKEQTKKLEQKPLDVAGAKNEYESLKKSTMSMFSKVTSPKKCRKKKRRSAAPVQEPVYEEKRRFQNFRRATYRKKSYKTKEDCSTNEEPCAAQKTDENTLNNSHSSEFSSTDFSVDSGSGKNELPEKVSEESNILTQSEIIPRAEPKKTRYENECVENSVKLIKPCYANTFKRNSSRDFVSVLNAEIEAEVSSCDCYMDMVKTSCSEIEQKIEAVAKRTLSKFCEGDEIRAELYGSIATCLALPESDLDILICGLRLYSKEDVVDAIHVFEEEIKSLQWVTECQSITSARVPVIKFIADLSKLNPDSGVKKLHVDITFEISGDNLPAPHPVLSADLVKFRCSQLCYLKPMTLLLKKLLKSSGLNNPFIGDISSYVLNLMVSAFLQMCRNSPSPAECFMELLRYYGKEFKNEQMMIVQGDYVMIMPVQVMSGRLVVTDPFRPGVNTAINVTRFDRVQECMNSMWEKLQKVKEEWKSGNTLKIFEMV